MSEIRPNDTRRVAVTMLYPNKIHRRYVNEVIGLIWIPLKIDGRAMRTMLRSIAASRVPRVVLERAIHLYCVC